jgi:hypothetical protein
VPLCEPEVEPEPVIEPPAPGVDAPREVATLPVSVGVSRPVSAGAVRVAAMSPPHVSYLTGSGGRLSDLMEPAPGSFNRRDRRAARRMARSR